MKISFEAPDEWAAQLDDLAEKDGHSNRAAVIRKIVNIFFADKSHFVAFGGETEKKPEESK